MNNSKETYLEVFHTIDFNEIKKHPNILIAANFWDKERYEAAKACYRIMRYIDDLIDDYKSEHKEISGKVKSEFKSKIKSWLLKFKNGKDHSELLVLREMIERFKIPVWPFENFANSMLYDIDHNGFESIHSFLDYSQGAAIAPASIFVHLCGLTKDQYGYVKPHFNVRNVATPCAIFSYIVHIIRDFEIDQKNNLNYFADELIVKYGMSTDILRHMADHGYVTGEFRDMIKEYYVLAKRYMEQTYSAICEIWPMVENRYRLSLLIIFNLYLMTFERIDPVHGTFAHNELEPTAEEIKERVYNMILDFSPDLYSYKKTSVLQVF